jgi:hypothetical protein
MMRALFRCGSAFALLLLAVVPGNAHAQKPTVTIHARVDTSNAEVRAVLQLWKDYLASKPDSLYDNPYWNAEEKLRLKNFDLSARHLYQFPAEQLLGYYQPTVLSVEKEGEHYGIRTLFSADGLKGEYRNSNPWCITKLYAVREGDGWKLKNALPIITRNWLRTTVGRITFIHSPLDDFDSATADKAHKFCDSLAAEYGFPAWEPFEFYITNSGDELGRLLNFDFFFPGFTTGMALRGERILLSGMGSPFYPHEFVHLVVPHTERHVMIEEGFATWKGGTMGRDFGESAALLAAELGQNNTVTLQDVLEKKWGWEVAAFYTTGAIFCEAAHARGGVPAVLRLLDAPPDNAAFLNILADVLGIREDQLNAYWRQEVSTYAP